jgi:hypothetical protein
MMTRDAARPATHTALVASAALAAATLFAATAPSGAARASERPLYGGEAVVAVGDPLLVADPALASSIAERALSRLLYEPLLERSAARDPLPALALGWETDADSTTWTFRLDGRVRFHDGSRLTAGDVVYSLHRVARRSGPNPYRWSIRNLSSVEADGDAVVVRFDSPEPRAPLMLACPGLAVIRAAAGAAFTDGFSYYEAPPGTGPFEIRRGSSAGTRGYEPRGPGMGRGARETDARGRLSHGEPSGVELVAFDGHRLGRPFLGAVTWRFSDFEDAAIELQARALEAVVGFPSPASGPLGGSTAASMWVIKSSHMLYLACNPTGALRERSERLRALSAVDRNSMIRSIVGPGGRIAQSLLPEEPPGPGLWREGSPRGSTPGSAGRTQGAGVSSLRLLAPRWHKTAGEVADRIQVDLMAAGFSVSLRKLGRSEMTYKLASGEFDLLVGLWEPDRWLDERSWLLSHFWETQIAPVPALAAVLRSTGGPVGSVPSALEEKLEEDCLLLPLFHLDTALLLRRGFVAVRGPDGLPEMPWSWIEKPGQ